MIKIIANLFRTHLFHTSMPLHLENKILETMNANKITQFEWSDPIKLEKFKIVDVRTPAEFLHGHIEGAMNIPFEKMDDWFQLILDWDCPIIICADWDCTSRRACEKLGAKGIEAIDGGNWIALEKKMNRDNLSQKK